jgi:hypothetical protein
MAYPSGVFEAKLYKTQLTGLNKGGLIKAWLLHESFYECSTQIPILLLVHFTNGYYIEPSAVRDPRSCIHQASPGAGFGRFHPKPTRASPNHGGGIIG